MGELNHTAKDTPGGIVETDLPSRLDRRMHPVKTAGNEGRDQAAMA